MKEYVGIILMVFALVSCNSNEMELRNILEISWSEYQDAYVDGNIEKLSTTMSSYKSRILANNLASVSKEFSRKNVMSVSHAHDMSKTEYVSILKHGETAGLIYIKDTEGDVLTGEKRLAFLFIRFVKEGGLWKVDRTGIFRQDKAEYVRNGYIFDLSLLPKEFQINGVVSLPPEVIPVAEIAGIINASSMGYKTLVKVNGYEQTRPGESYPSGYIVGGLKRGSNIIEMRFEKDSVDHAFLPGVVLELISKDKKHIEVFKYVHDGDKNSLVKREVLIGNEYF